MTFISHRIFIILLFTLCTLSLGLSQLTLDGSINVDGVERTYILHFPTNNTEGSTDLPLVFNLHGYTSNAAQQEFYSAMNTTADNNNFIVCYPEGLGNAWNIGINGGSTADDVGFISALIDEFATLYQINTNRVYSCGMSNGGFMSYELACKVPEKFAAIASVTGSMVSNIDCDLNTSGMPVLQIHGTDDPIVDYDGSFGIMPIEDVIEFWVDKNSCDIDSVTLTPIPDTNMDDNSTVEHIIHSSCHREANVELFKVIGGAHTWPGAALVIAATNYDINASEEIWKFFNRYTIDGSATSVNETQLSEITLSPNPGDQQLLINTSQNITGPITLRDMHGNLVLSTQDKQINVSHLPSSMYILTLTLESNIITKKVVIQH